MLVLDLDAASEAQNVVPAEQVEQAVELDVAEGAVAEECVLRRLRLVYGGRALTDLIQGAVGPEQAVELVKRVVAYTNELLTFPRSSAKPLAENDFKMRAALSLGTLGPANALPWVESMLNHLWKREEDPVWRTSIQAATRPWLEHLQDVTAKVGPVDADGFAATIGSVPSARDTSDAAGSRPAWGGRRPAGRRAARRATTCGIHPAAGGREPLASAPRGSEAMSTTKMRDLAAQVAELEAKARLVPHDQAAQLHASAEAVRQTMAMLAPLEPTIAEQMRSRAPLAPEIQAFFTPEPPAPVPAWLPDTLTRGDFVDAMLRCPPGARIYHLDDGASCAFAGVAGQQLSRAHGLTVKFFASTGRIASQTLYEEGVERWAVDYHPTGGRAMVTFYGSREPADFAPHGLHTQLNLDGVITAQAHYDRGERQGWTKLWEDDGYPAAASLYEHDQAVAEVLSDGTRRRL